MPPSSAISDSTDQTITFAVGLLSTRGSGGQLFVYEYLWPGRFAAAAHAVQAKNAVSCRSSVRSVIAFGCSPC